MFEEEIGSLQLLSDQFQVSGKIEKFNLKLFHLVSVQQIFKKKRGKIVKTCGTLYDKIQAPKILL